MNEQGINLRKKRDFGELLSVTFEFLKENFKPLLRTLLIYVGPMILIAAIFSAVFQTKNMQNMFANDMDSLMEMFDYRYFLAIIASLISNILLIGAVYGYMSLYLERGRHGFEIEDVWESMKENFWMLLGTSIITGILTVLGFILLIIPGIYIGISLSLVLAMRVIERNSLGDAISRSFSLIRGDWWATFGLIIVVYIIVGMLSMVFVIPQTIVTALMGINTLNAGSSDFSLLFTIITVITTFCTSFLSAIPIITIAFQYFSLVEKKESPGLKNRIREINEEKDENRENTTHNY